ncbi:MAG: hypothetical protein ACK5NN_00385 [Sphingomonadaceae bacterium]
MDARLLAKQPDRNAPFISAIFDSGDYFLLIHMQRVFAKLQTVKRINANTFDKLQIAAVFAFMQCSANG